MLTRKQHELLMFIDSHLRETGFSPSFEEMKDTLQLKSKSGIHRLITALEERGFLKRRHHRARALEVIRMPQDARPRPSAVVALGLVPGGASAGTPGTPSTASAMTSAGAAPATSEVTAGFSPNVIQ